MLGLGRQWSRQRVSQGQLLSLPCSCKPFQRGNGSRKVMSHKAVRKEKKNPQGYRLCCYNVISEIESRFCCLTQVLGWIQLSLSAKWAWRPFRHLFQAFRMSCRYETNEVSPLTHLLWVCSFSDPFVVVVVTK